MKLTSLFSTTRGTVKWADKHGKGKHIYEYNHVSSLALIGPDGPALKTLISRANQAEPTRTKPNRTEPNRQTDKSSKAKKEPDYGQRAAAGSLLAPVSRVDPKQTQTDRTTATKRAN